MRRAVPALVLLSLLAAPAQAREWWMAPGNMGANALPTIPAIDPFPDPNTLATVGWGYQLGRLSDHSTVPVFRILAPFGRYVTMISEGTPAEAWWASPQSQSDWKLARTSGLEQGDVRFGVLFRLLEAHRGTTVFAFRALTKATTGKNVPARRFTDAPAYLLDFVFGQRFGTHLGVDLELVQTLGFFIWQQGSSGQDDSLHAALSLRAHALGRLHLGLELRAYVGWALFDRPVVTAGRVGVDLTDWLELAVIGNVGFFDAPRLDARLELTFKLPAVVPVVLE